MGRNKSGEKILKGVTVRKGARVGAGSIILPGIEIGEEAVVAAGSIVTRNIPAGETYMGVPARKYKNTPVHELLVNQLLKDKIHSDRH